MKRKVDMILEMVNDEDSNLTPYQIGRRLGISERKVYKLVMDELSNNAETKVESNKEVE